MNCHQCGNKCRVKFREGTKPYCSSSCAGYKPREVKHRASFQVEDDKVVYVDAGVEEEMSMPAHYELERVEPAKVAKAHKEKVGKHFTREALKREFEELRGTK